MFENKRRKGNANDIYCDTYYSAHVVRAQADSLTPLRPALIMLVSAPAEIAV